MTLMEQLPSLGRVMASVPAKLAADIGKYLDVDLPEAVARSAGIVDRAIESVQVDLFNVDEEAMA